MIPKPCDFNGKKGVHMAHLNIRSLWNKIDLVRQTIKSSNLDMMSLSESWLNESMNSSLINIPGYLCIRHDRSWTENNATKKGGGICCYVKDNIQVSHVEFNMSTKDIELLWISLNFPKSKKLIIGNVYRPPEGNVKSFCDLLDSTLTLIRDKQNNSHEIFILGDFNINVRTPSNPETKLLKWFEQRSSLKQIITDVTRYSNLNSCIDLIFTDCLSISDYGTLDVNLSDHEMIFLTRKHVSKPKVSSSFMGRSYLNYDKNLFTTSLKTKDWEPFYNSVNPNIAWAIMEQIIKTEIDIM